MNLRLKLALCAVILCLALGMAFKIRFLEQNHSALQVETVKAQDTHHSPQTPRATKEVSPIRSVFPHKASASTSENSRQEIDDAINQLEQELADGQSNLAAIQQQAYLDNPYLKIWEDYRNAPRNWSDADPLARAAQRFKVDLAKSDDPATSKKKPSRSDIDNMVLPLLMVKIESADPQFRDLLLHTFDHYVKGHMKLLEGAGQEKTPATLDEFISTVKKWTPAQNEAIQRVASEMGMSPEIVEGIERRNMGQLLTGLVDIYLGLKTPEELSKAREAVRSAEILLGREKAKLAPQREN